MIYKAQMQGGPCLKTVAASPAWPGQDMSTVMYSTPQWPLHHCSVHTPAATPVDAEAHLYLISMGLRPQMLEWPQAGVRNPLPPAGSVGV